MKVDQGVELRDPIDQCSRALLSQLRFLRDVGPLSLFAHQPERLCSLRSFSSEAVHAVSGAFVHAAR